MSAELLDPAPPDPPRPAMGEALQTLVAAATGLPSGAIDVALRPPLDHQSNRLYDVRAGSRHLIAKEYLKAEEFITAPQREFQALHLLASLDIAPRPIHWQPCTSLLGPVVIYEFMEGEMWDRRCPLPAELARLATAWLAVHSVSADGLWPSRGTHHSPFQVVARFRTRFQAYAAWVDAEFPAGRRAAGLCLSLLEQRHPLAAELASHEPLLCFSRADARFANVIRRPDGRLGLVDWEDSGLRDPAVDVADLLTAANQEDLVSPTRWRAFLDPYFAARSPLDPDLPQRVHLYLALFPLLWLSLLLGEGMRLARAGRLVGWTVNGLPANRRLQRYLARGLAWPDMGFSHRLAELEMISFFPVSV